MKEFRGTASVLVDAPPRVVFDRIVDVDRLTEWNRAIERVVDSPRDLDEGSTWTVRMHPRRSPSWGSESRVETLDRHALRFAYETRNTNGNPSYTKWSWQVLESDGASHVTVQWVGRMLTLDRRLFAGPIRKRALEREVAASLAALASVSTRPSPR